MGTCLPVEGSRIRGMDMWLVGYKTLLQYEPPYNAAKDLFGPSTKNHPFDNVGQIVRIYYENRKSRIVLLYRIIRFDAFSRAMKIFSKNLLHRRTMTLSLLKNSRRTKTAAQGKLR